MNPKTTRKFSTKEKTSTPEGKRDYQRQYMREYREHEKETVGHARLTLTETLSDRFYDQTPAILKPAITQASDITAFYGLTENQILQKGYERIFHAVEIFQYTGNANLATKCELYRNMLTDLIELQDKTFTRKVEATLEALIRIQEGTLHLIDLDLEGQVRSEEEKKQMIEYRPKLEHAIKTYREALDGLKGGTEE
jgi:hypothetical protein